jgi:hypothetical protein
VETDSAYRTIHVHIFVVSDAMLHYSPILKQAALSPSIGDHRYLNNRGDGKDIPMDWFSPAVFVWFDGRGLVCSTNKERCAMMELQSVRLRFVGRICARARVRQRFHSPMHPPRQISKGVLLLTER